MQSFRLANLAGIFINLSWYDVNSEYSRYEANTLHHTIDLAPEKIFPKTPGILELEIRALRVRVEQFRAVFRLVFEIKFLFI